ncbi:MAG: AraC family transcriptional regulator [Pseudomonadota bacterium]
MTKTLLALADRPERVGWMAPEVCRESVETTLEQLLSHVRLESAFYFEVVAKAPWATLTPHMRNIGHVVMPEVQRVLPFHIMLDGEAWCWRADDPSDKRWFKTGDILMLPRGCDHIIASTRSPNSVPEPDTEIYREAETSQRPCTYVDIGGDGERASFVCGYFGVPRQSFHPLFDSLADLLILTPTPEKWDLLQQLVGVATREQSDRRTGGKLVTSRLAETMFIDAVHQHLLHLDPASTSGWLVALRDRNISLALEALHSSPMHPWTVELLAKEARLSRSAFTERFQELIGRPPIQYLQSWRMQLAADQLAQTDKAIKCIAEDCGYAAETSFHRAFKHQTGYTPGAWRALHEVAR